MSIGQRHIFETCLQTHSSRWVMVCRTRSHQVRRRRWCVLVRAGSAKVQGTWC